MSEKKSEVDEEKGKTLDEISEIITRITASINVSVSSDCVLAERLGLGEKEHAGTSHPGCAPAATATGRAGAAAQ